MDETKFSADPEVTRSRLAVFDPEGDILTQYPNELEDLKLSQLQMPLTKRMSIATIDPELGGITEVMLEQDDRTEIECETEEKYDEATAIQQDPPVLAAVIVTISWLFLCSGIFVIWEDWTYWTSFYFFFISLITIGFGDVYPEYPEFMIMNFGLILIGLALVSVCINVVQQKIENLYMFFLLSLLGEYQKAMELGHGEASKCWHDPDVEQKQES